MTAHSHPHAFESLEPHTVEGLTLHSRRNMLKAGLAGMAGLSLPDVLRARSTGKAKKRKSVILLWMAGGPSHIDTWDPKPGRPEKNRGPFSTIPTKIPGVRICEHLPKQAALMERMTLIRSVDARGSNHQPNTVFQTGHRGAAPRVNKAGAHYPAIGSVIAKMHGGNSESMPPYVAYMKHRSHLAWAGHLGRRYEPFIANRATPLPVLTNVGKDTGRVVGGDLFRLPTGLTMERIQERQSLMQSFDQMRLGLDRSGSMDAMDEFGQQAVSLLTSRKAQEAFDLSQEPTAVRERYGKHLWCQQALLARRLVEAGAAFVTLDLSYHTASGTWDTHGDNIPPYGGISKGLGPLLPLFDHLYTTLFLDLEQRGLMDEVLLIAMGEFGRTPNMGTQGSTDGRNHWPVVMSMTMAGGGLKHGQVIGATEADGGHIKNRPVTPGDLSATIYQHMGVPVDTVYHEPNGRPIYVVENGKPIEELF